MWVLASGGAYRVGLGLVRTSAQERQAVVPRCSTQGLAKAVGEVAGAGEAAGQGDFPQGQGAVAQQIAGPDQAPGQDVLMGRQAEACAEHAGEVVFGKAAQPRQLAQAQGASSWLSM